MQRRIICILFFTFLLIELVLPSIVIAISPASEPTYLGIDVSSWQGYIDYDKVRDDGVKYVYIKATEGISYTDKYLKYNYENAKRVGMKIGFYHFVRARTADRARQEARHFANAISGMEPECKLAMDFEEFGNLTINQINEISFAFLHEVKNITGKDLVVYSNTYSASTKFSQELANNYPLWVAHYGVNNPTDNGKWKYWVGFQYTSKGKINGINGYVDLNRFTKEILLESKEISPIPKPDRPTEEETKTIYYTVKWGDTLSQIATQYGTTIQNLVNLNNIQNPNLIYVGQRLIIMANEQNQNESIVYTVKWGDTLSQIAADYGTTIQNLVSLNNIQNPNLIFVGQKIIIRTTEEQDIIHDCGHVIYHIKWGDTLSGIATRFGVTVQSIVDENDIKNPNLIYAGAYLRICIVKW